VTSPTGTSCNQGKESSSQIHSIPLHYIECHITAKKIHGKYVYSKWYHADIIGWQVLDLENNEHQYPTSEYRIQSSRFNVRIIEQIYLHK
jgi:hypothetical protein